MCTKTRSLIDEEVMVDNTTEYLTEIDIKFIPGYDKAYDRIHVSEGLIDYIYQNIQLLNDYSGMTVTSFG